MPARAAAAAFGGSEATAMGVIVPATAPKMATWSARCSTRAWPGVRESRW